MMKKFVGDVNRGKGIQEQRADGGEEEERASLAWWLSTRRDTRIISSFRSYIAGPWPYGPPAEKEQNKTNW
jgi:hypothetical protein